MRIYDEQEKKIIMNGHTFAISVNAFETSSSWGHDARVYIDGELSGTAHTVYYNRTWERYRFQSVILLALSAAINEQIEIKKYLARHENGGRLKRGQAEQIKNDVKSSPRGEAIAAAREYFLTASGGSWDIADLRA